MKTTFIILTLICNLLIWNLQSHAQSSITYDAGTNIDVGTGADICADNIYINGTFSGGGTICTGPLPVMLSSFTSSVNKNNVVLSWITEFELNNSGFDIERKLLKDGESWKKASFIQGHGTVKEQ